MTKKGFSHIELQLGIICLVIAIIIIIIIDKWAEKKKKEELDIIDKEIDERAEKIAEELVLKHLEEIENENMWFNCFVENILHFTFLLMIP